MRYKARLCAKGFAQKYGIDYVDTYATVSRLSSIRLLLSVAVQDALEIIQLDVTTAFLYGKLDEEIYMSVPEVSQQEMDKCVNSSKACMD